MSDFTPEALRINTSTGIVSLTLTHIRQSLPPLVTPLDGIAKVKVTGAVAGRVASRGVPYVTYCT